MRSLYKFRLLAALADTLAGRGRRTALVWVASAVAHTCGSELAPPDSRVLSAQRRFHEAANSANVAVYAVDPSARIDLDVQVADASIPMGFLPGGVRAAGADGSMMLQAIARQRRILAQLRDALFNAADETSGRAFVAWAELAEVLGEIREDSRRYYLLTYAAPPPMEDGDYHEIRVKVRRDGARVRARKGYVDYGRDERRERSIETASAFPGLADGPTVWLRAHRIWTSKSQPRVVLVASVDPYELGRVYEANGEASISLELRASAADENGVELVAELTDEVRLSVADVGSGPLVRRYAWNVAPGRYGLHVLVVDRATDRVGTASVEIEVPDRSSADWFVSDPILLARENEPEGQLLVADHVIVGKPLAAYLEVYGGEEPVLGGWVESALGAAPLELSPIRMRRGADGISRASLSVPAPFSGRYTIHLWVRDARANQHWSFALPIEAVPTGGAF